MFGYELTSLAVIAAWSLAAVFVGVLCGFILGRGYTLLREPKALAKDRERTLQALVALMASTDQLNEDVDTHNTELQTVQVEVQQVAADLEMTDAQQALLTNISKVIASNRRLENDLVQTRYKMEHQAQLLDRTRQEARTDSLCGVSNRKAYDETIQFVISRFRSKGKSFGLMLIDVDHFKRINDTFGHAAGDQVLSNICDALKDCVRPKDFVGRLGGDEFTIIFGGLKAEQAERVGDRIHSALELVDFRLGEGNESTVVTLSMGMTIVQPKDTAKTIYQRADRALYRAKELGRNRLYVMIDDNDDYYEAQQVSTQLPVDLSVLKDPSFMNR